MRVAVGTKLGPYEVVALLGAGGMGEVYRAWDPRLARHVAIKVLSASLLSNPERLHRFENEARATGMLNHPNILAVYDVGTSDGTAYVVTELLEGETLRELLARTALPARKVIECGAQIARGLAAAHVKGIIHRDLKPENLFITKDGHVKILDFGLAKLIEPLNSLLVEQTLSVGTEPGVVLGTVGYMAPEQVRGQEVDARCDLFALGAILYEMVSGHRAFPGDSAADVLSLILKESPKELSQSGVAVTPTMERIVFRCLEKEKLDRFQTARDLCFALEAIATASSSGTIAVQELKPHGKIRLVVASLAVIAVAAAASFLAGRYMLKAGLEPAQTFSQLTFRRGTIHSARFSGDGETVVYSAEWNGEASEVFTTSGKTPESRSLGSGAASVLAVSHSGELAVVKSCAAYLMPTAECGGTLGRMNVSGSAAREIAANAWAADWSPNGKDLAVIRFVDGRFRLEYPLNRVLVESGGWMGSLRISPNGELIAYVEHPIVGDDGGTVMIIDRQGRRKQSTGPWSAIEGLAWTPAGDEVWFSGTMVHEGWGNTLRALDLAGRVRKVLRLPGLSRLHDISSDGSVLLSTESFTIELMVHVSGDDKERDLSWLEATAISDLSPDGRLVTFWDGGESATEETGFDAYIRRTDGSPAIKLGPGYLPVFAPDGKWILAGLGSKVVLLPTGVGEMKSLPNFGIENHLALGWFPDGKRFAFAGNESKQGWRIYTMDIGGGQPKAITPDISPPGTYDGACISPDGKRVWARDLQHRAWLYPLDGGQPAPLRGLQEEDGWMNWTGDGRSAFVFSGGRLPAQVFRLDFESGRREPLKTLRPADSAGVLMITTARISRDGKTYAYSYPRMLSRLFLVSGGK